MGICHCILCCSGLLLKTELQKHFAVLAEGLELFLKKSVTYSRSLQLKLNGPVLARCTSVVTNRGLH
jgi:hypothetical protein